MSLLDLLGRRWVLRILWELQQGPLTFRGLQKQCDAMSPSVLNQRLRELRAAGIVEAASSGGYRLTPQGAQLCRALAPLSAWAGRWKRARK